MTSEAGSTAGRQAVAMRQARIRTEAFELGDGVRIHLLALASNRTALAFAVRIDPRTHAVTQGAALFHGDAFACRGEDLAAAMPFEPMGVLTLRDLGVVDGGSHYLAGDAIQVLDILQAPEPFREGRGPRSIQEPGVDPFLHEWHWHGDPKNMLSRLCLHLPEPMPSPGPGLSRVDLLDTRTRPGSSLGFLPDRRILEMELPHHARFHPGSTWEDRICRSLSAWLKRLRKCLVPEGLPTRSLSGWSATAYARYMAGGEVGRRRRQAAALYPAFAATLACDPLLASMVDEGRPYERALVDQCRKSVADSMPYVDASAFDVARLRRMRLVPRELGEGSEPNLRKVVGCLCALPFHMVPDSLDAWENFLIFGWVIVDGHEFGYLDPRHALRSVPRDWSLRGIYKAFGDYSDPGLHARLFQGYKDWVDQAVEDLCAAGADGRVLDPSAAIRVRTAFLEGVSLVDAWELQEAWHRDQDIFTTFRSYGRDVAWTALFEPFEARGCVRLRCLTTPAELAAEGARGIDGDGLEGLAHCVGGYVRRCLDGTSHIVSVTGIRDGKRVRLSTVEICPEPYPRLVVRQHAGRANRPPDADAVAGLDTLLAAIGEGRVRCASPDPGTRREEPETIDPVRAFEAWRPFMPKRMAREGLEGLRRTVGNLP